MSGRARPVIMPTEKCLESSSTMNLAIGLNFTPSGVRSISVSVPSKSKKNSGLFPFSRARSSLLSLEGVAVNSEINYVFIVVQRKREEKVVPQMTGD